MDETISNNQPQLSREQYEMLLRCSEKGEITEWNKWRIRNPDEKILLQGAELRDANLQGAYLRRANLHSAYLSRANLQGAELDDANLEGAELDDANLQGAYLRRANLQGAELDDVNLQGAELTASNLQGTKLWAANLQGAELGGANLHRANLGYANLQGAELGVANLEGADLRNANLEGAKLWSVNLENANVTGARLNRKTTCRGIRAGTCYGSPRFKRQAADQDFLEELRSTRRGKVIYYIWLWLADCGRSFWPLLLWSLGIAALFGLVFYALGPSAFEITNLPEENYLTMLYYSIVTFTTLGFGDVTPNTLRAAMFVMVEVIFGYIMLGMLISVLANKVGRRSGL